MRHNAVNTAHVAYSEYNGSSPPYCSCRGTAKAADTDKYEIDVDDRDVVEMEDMDHGYDSEYSTKAFRSWICCHN